MWGFGSVLQSLSLFVFRLVVGLVWGWGDYGMELVWEMFLVFFVVLFGCGVGPWLFAKLFFLCF